MSALEDRLREVVEDAAHEAVSAALEDAELSGGARPRPSWAERLWTAPTETRIGLPEVVEAMGVSESWIYSRTRADADDPIPHRKLGGGLRFRVGELRAWVRRTESVEMTGPSDPPEGTVQLDSEAA